jgi:hypothetical protein
MKETKEKVYRCDFCNKAIIQKGSMTLHERMCKKNPKNMHKCFQYCKHLIKDTATTCDDDGNRVNVGFSFSCALNPDVEMFSYKLERFKSNAGRIEKMLRMPLECDKYELSDDHYDYGLSQMAAALADDFISNAETIKKKNRRS